MDRLNGLRVDFQEQNRGTTEGTNRQQQLFAIAGFGVKLKFMFQKVIRSQGTISQQVGFNIPLRSIFKASYARNCK